LIARLAAGHERQSARGGAGTDGLSQDVFHGLCCLLLFVCPHWAVIVIGNFSRMSSAGCRIVFCLNLLGFKFCLDLLAG
jgi:hypothetical protein